MNLPDEIINHIFSYCQGRTNKIMKRYIYYASDMETGVIGLNRLNNDYGFKIFNKDKLNQALWYCCPVCKINLWPIEYKRNINYEGHRMCSRQCLLQYESAISMMHLSYL
jgi:hypothetical protein